MGGPSSLVGFVRETVAVNQRRTEVLYAESVVEARRSRWTQHLVLRAGCSNLWIIVFSAGDFTREVITKSTEKGNGEAFGTAQDNMVNTFGTSSRERTIEYTFGSL